jgi:hypothetical protein
MIRFLLAAALVALGPAAAAQEAPPAAPVAEAGPGLENGGGIVYGARFAFSVQAPAGWLFDNQSGAHQGLHAVAYRKGETYGESESLMYANGQNPVDGRHGTDDVVAADLAAFRANSPNLQTFEIEPIELADGTKARVVGFRGDQWGNVEAVAYAEHEGAVYILVLTARSQARFDEDLPAFREFVHSVMPMDKGAGDASGG